MAENIEIGDYNFVTVQGWMRNEYDLSGASLIIYAIIYGFSQAENQWCSASQKYFEEWSGTSLNTVKRALNDMLKKGFIKKRYFINETGRWCEYKAIIPDKIREVSFSTKGQNGLTPKGQNGRGMAQNGLTQRANLVNYTIKNNIEDNIDNNIEGKTPAPESKKRFVKPTVDEIAAYISEKGYTISAEKFFNYYESNGWKVGKNPMKNWKSAVSNWQNSDYNNNNKVCGGNNTKSYEGNW